MGATPEGARGPATRLGMQAGHVVQELGYDDDVDDALRASIEELTGSELVDEDYDDVVDAVLLWWRDGDGDLVDALVDASNMLGPGGVVWLLTPKVGHPDHVDPADVADAAPTAGFATTSSVAVAPTWTATRLVAPKSKR